MRANEPWDTLVGLATIVVMLLVVFGLWQAIKAIALGS